MSQFTLSDLWSVSWRMPIYVVWIGGIVFAVRYWSRAPKVGLVVTTTLSILIVSSAGHTLFTMILLNFGDLITKWQELVLRASLYTRHLDSIVHSGAWAVILWVLFGLVRQLSDMQQAAAAVLGPPESS